MLQNTFHFVCRHYEGSYSEISVIRFVVPVCFASGLLQFSCFGHCGFRRQGWSGESTPTRTIFAEPTGSVSAAFQCRFGYFCPPSTALAVRVYYQLKVMDAPHRQQLQVFLKELDTEDAFFQLAAQERYYTEQALQDFYDKSTRTQNTSLRRMQDCRHVWAGLLPQNSTEHGRDNKELTPCVLPRSMRCASVVSDTRAVKATRLGWRCQRELLPKRQWRTLRNFRKNRTQCWRRRSTKWRGTNLNTAGNAANVSGAAERRKATNEPTRTRLRGEQKAPSVLHSG